MHIRCSQVTGCVHRITPRRCDENRTRGGGAESKDHARDRSEEEAKNLSLYRIVEGNPGI